MLILETRVGSQDYRGGRVDKIVIDLRDLQQKINEPYFDIATLKQWVNNATCALRVHYPKGNSVE